MSNPDDFYRSVFSDDQSLAIFLRNMQKFDNHFCELMNGGVEFTIRLEVHGNQGELLHCRVQHEGFDRPSGVEKRIDRKRKRA